MLRSHYPKCEFSALLKTSSGKLGEASELRTSVSSSQSYRKD